MTATARGASATLVPTLLVVAAGFALALGSVLTKRYGPFAPLQLMAWISLFTVPQALVVSLAFEDGQFASLQAAGLPAWSAFAYTVVFGAVAGWGLWFWLIAQCRMARLAPFSLLQIVFAIAAGAVFLHEPLTVALVAGAVVCVVGVAITQIASFDPGRTRTQPGAAAAPGHGEGT